MQRKRDKWRNDGNGEVDKKRKNTFLFPGSIYFHFWPVRSHLVFDNPPHIQLHFFPRFPHAMCSPSSCFSSLVPFSILVLTSALVSPFFLHFSIFIPSKSLLSLSFLYFSSYVLVAPFFPPFFICWLFRFVLVSPLPHLSLNFFLNTQSAFQCFSFLHFSVFFPAFSFLVRSVLFPYVLGATSQTATGWLQYQTSSVSSLT